MAGHAPGNQFYTPGSIFGGAQTMMCNPMYGSFGMQLGCQSTQGQFGMLQANFGMPGITNQQPFVASSGQNNSGQGTQMNPNNVSMFQSLPYDNLTLLEKPTPYKGGKGVTFTTFTGFDDRKKALSSLQQFDKAYAGGNFTEASNVRKAATFLKGNAGQWWTTLLLQGQAPATWIDSKQIFASAWLSDDFEADVMTEWHQLNAASCKNLDDYNRKFWKALLPVTSYSRFRFSVSETPSNYAQEPVKAWKRKATAEPAKGPAKKWGRPFACKSEEQKQVLRSENKCFICEQLGHIAPNCPQRKKSADSEDNEDRKGKKPMAGLVPDMVGDKPNSDASCSTPMAPSVSFDGEVDEVIGVRVQVRSQRDTKELSDIGIQCISHYDWHEDPLGTPIFPIPKNEIFHINGVAFEVRLSCIQGAGYGLFVHSAIESGVTILHYGGPKYGFQEWKKICKLIPRAIKYSLVEDPKVEEEEDRAYILGFVEEGNVSGYINSSHCMDFHPNVRYALDPNLPPWYKGISSHIKSEEYGHICIETICRVEPGEELFANYEFT
ncbi:hypothetical protein L7F22_016098 [Adiantum nelumboides]|nr:hypothetical protein [Adiantum nelumboides]